MSADKAKRTLLAIDIPRDELALRMLTAVHGMVPPAGTTAAQALAQFDALNPGWVDLLRAQADAAVLYFHERLNSAKQPH